MMTNVILVVILQNLDDIAKERFVMDIHIVINTDN